MEDRRAQSYDNTPKSRPDDISAVSTITGLRKTPSGTNHITGSNEKNDNWNNNR